MRILLLAAFIFYSSSLVGQTYPTPQKIRFADIELRLSESLRREIQAEVDALSRNPKYLNIKLDRAKLYFPIIERIFQEENLPDDFKYLVLQESALIPDAVSTSNAVGFWQFKKESAEEVGLRVDGVVDERMNIVSSTRGAARYLKKNNYYFDNWMYALLGYYAGRGGAEKMTDKKQYGAKTMNLDRDLHWYLKKYLAHKVVFEQALRDYPSPNIYLYEHNYAANKSLKDVARDFSVSEQEVFDYNKWLKRENAPNDKEYTVLVPLKTGSQPTSAVAQNIEPKNTHHHKQKPPFQNEDDKFPQIEEFEGFDSYRVKINGKQGVLAKNETDNISSLALIGNISVERFKKYNDLDKDDEIKVGHVYYLQSKRNKAKVHYHVLQPNENLWLVSQKFGIKLNKLKQKNRIEKNEEVKPGRVLWLRFIRPASEPIEYKPVNNYLAKQESTPVRVTNDIEAPSPTPLSQKTIQTPVENKKEIVSPKQETALNETTPVLKEPNQTHQTITVDEKERNLQDQNTNSEIYHIVKQGETLYSISRAYAVPLNQIMSLNNLSYNDGIKIGQRLTIKKDLKDNDQLQEINQSAAKSYTYHKVIAGDTLYKIARQYNVTIQELMDWNNKSDFNVSIGENLIVSK